MRKHFFINLCMAASLCLLTVFSGCKDINSLFRAEHQRTEHTSVPIAGVAGLNVETDVGSITVTGAEVTDCNITAEITVKAQTKEEARKLAEEVKMEFESSDETLTIKVVKPAELKKRSLVVDFKIIAPRRMKLDCSTGVGTVTVSDIEGRIEASVNVGSIACYAVVAELDLSSNVGSVKVKYADAAPAACKANITTNVGSIEFTAPSELSAQVHASTNIGSVETARPITVVGKVGKSIKGTIGSGEGKVLLKTNVGSIEIK
jgi:hypothetical protein